MKTNCQICPRGCLVDREKSVGFCNEKSTIRIAKVIEHFMWEEPCLADKRGTLAIFFSGCNLRCDYCQNFEISRGGVGKTYSIDEFCKLIEEKQDSHSSIDLITPTHFSDALIEVFKKIDKKVPVIWNTNSYETAENIEKASSFVDVFLADFKYADDALGKKFSKCLDYSSVATNTISKMCQLKPDIFQENQITQGVIIRHLVLPGHVKNTIKVLDIIKQHFPNRMVSLMSQFTPNGKSELNQKLKPIEYKLALEHMQNLDLENGYVQDFDSATETYVPDFLS